MILPYYIMCGWNRGFFHAVLGTQHPAVLYDAKQCCMRNADQSVFNIQHCWHSIPAYLYTDKNYQMVMGFVVLRNHNIYSSKVNMQLISLVRQPHTKIHPYNTINYLEHGWQCWMW